MALKRSHLKLSTGWGILQDALEVDAPDLSETEAFCCKHLQTDLQAAVASVGMVTPILAASFLLVSLHQRQQSSSS